MDARFMLAAALFAGGCQGSELAIELRPARLDLAVGGTGSVYVNRGCKTRQNGEQYLTDATVIVGPACDEDVNAIDALRWAPSDAPFEAEARHFEVLVTATSRGTAELEVRLDTTEGERTVEGTVRAWDVNRVALSSDCGQQNPVEISTSARLHLRYELFHETRRLAGVGPFFEAPGLEPGFLGPEVYLTAPGTPGRILVTSPRVPTFGYEVVVHDATTIERVRLEPWNPLIGRVGEADVLEIIAETSISAGTALCVNALPHELTNHTPDVCEIESPSAIPFRTLAVVVHGVQPGECRIEVTFTGTSLRAETAYLITES